MIDKFVTVFVMIQENTQTLLGRTRARRDGVSVPALILIIQQHTSDNAAQMPELQTQVLSGLVLIAVNWCSNTSRHMWPVRNMVRTEGIVKSFSARAVFDHPGALCSVVLDKRTDFYRNSLFNSQKSETFDRTKGTFVFSNLWHHVCLCEIDVLL